MNIHFDSQIMALLICFNIVVAGVAGWFSPRIWILVPLQMILAWVLPLCFYAIPLAIHAIDPENSNGLSEYRAFASLIVRTSMMIFWPVIAICGSVGYILRRHYITRRKIAA